MNTLLRLSALALTATLALTGCSSPDDRPPGESKSDVGPGQEAREAPEGKTQPLTGDTFTTEVPEEWTEVTDRARELQPLVLVAYAAPTEGDFTTNLNVVRLPLAEDYTRDETIAQFKRELATLNATPIGEAEDATMGGEPALVFLSEATAGDGQAYIGQAQVTKDGQSYVVSVTSRDQAEASAILAEAVDGWEWK